MTFYPVVYSRIRGQPDVWLEMLGVDLDARPRPSRRRTRTRAMPIKGNRSSS